MSVYELLKPRAEDGYLSATLMCQAYNRKLSHWLENNSTTALVDALSLETGIPTSKLVQIIKGRGDVIQQGTWIHPDLAVQLAQWLDPRFALFVSRLVRSYFSGHRQSQYLELPTDFEGALELSLTLVRMNKDLHNRIATVRAQLEDVINTLDGLEGN